MTEREKELVRNFINRIYRTDEIFSYLKLTAIATKLIELKAERKAELVEQKLLVDNEIKEL